MTYLASGTVGCRAFVENSSGACQQGVAVEQVLRLSLSM